MLKIPRTCLILSSLCLLLLSSACFKKNSSDESKSSPTISILTGMELRLAEAGLKKIQISEISHITQKTLDETSAENLATSLIRYSILALKEKRADIKPELWPSMIEIMVDSVIEGSFTEETIHLDQLQILVTQVIDAAILACEELEAGNRFYYASVVSGAVLSLPELIDGKDAIAKILGEIGLAAYRSFEKMSGDKALIPKDSLISIATGFGGAFAYFAEEGLFTPREVALFQKATTDAFSEKLSLNDMAELRTKLNSARADFVNQIQLKCATAGGEWKQDEELCETLDDTTMMLAGAQPNEEDQDACWEGGGQIEYTNNDWFCSTPADPDGHE